jgi:hypothetical protein
MASVQKMFKGLTSMTVTKPKYKLHIYDQLLLEVEKQSKNLSAITGISQENCIIILFHFKWDSQTLVDKLYDDRLERFLTSKCDFKLLSDNDKDIVCDEKCQQCGQVKKVAHLSCEHKFCYDCWRSYARHVQSTTTTEGVLPYIKCDYEGCIAPAPKEFVLQLFCDPETYHLYQHMVINSFVESNPLFKWCPNHDCKCAVEVDDTDVKEITCQCGLTYCFSCDDVCHSPIPCTYIKQWNEIIEEYEKPITNFICPNQECGEYVFFDNGYTYGDCPTCNRRVSLYACMNSRPKRVEIEHYLSQKRMLQDEYLAICKLEKVKDVDFIKKSLKYIHDFRQIILNIDILLFFESGSLMSIPQESVKKQLENVTKLLNYPQISEDIQLPLDKKNDIVELLIKIKKVVDGHLDSFD